MLKISAYQLQKLFVYLAAKHVWPCLRYDFRGISKEARGKTLYMDIVCLPTAKP